MSSFLGGTTEESTQEVAGAAGHTRVVEEVAEVEEPGRHSIPQATQFQRAVKSVPVARALMTSFLTVRISHECPHVSETLSAGLKARHKDAAALVPVEAAHRQPAEGVVARAEAGHSNSRRPARWSRLSISELGIQSSVSRNHLLLLTPALFPK